jgi:hypothetical protein
MQKLFTTLSFLAIIIIISSCATTHPNEIWIVGNWKPIKSEIYVPPAKPVAPGDTVKSKKKSAQAVQVSTVEQQQRTSQLDRMVANELRSPVIIKVEGKKKIVQKYYPGKTAEGTWKMKKNGQRLVAKETNTGKTITMDILALNDTNAIVVERFPYGDIKVTYKRIQQVKVK